MRQAPGQARCIAVAVSRPKITCADLPRTKRAGVRRPAWVGHYCPNVYRRFALIS
jgi:hypothetical protein